MNQEPTNALQHLRLPASEIKPEEDQRGKWRWREAGSGLMWMCFWPGGEWVDCYGPFAPDGPNDKLTHGPNNQNI